MVRELVMPKLGLTMTEGTIIKWFFNEGDSVKEGDVIYEVETDKLTNEIAADTGGVLRKIIVHEGETAPVKSLVGLIADENEDISNFTGEARANDETKPSGEAVGETDYKAEEVVTVNKTDYILATPYAKKIAKDRNIDLSKISPTGYNGVIISKDVDQFIL